VKIPAGIDQHAPVNDDLVDIGAVTKRDQSAPRIEQRLQMRMGQVDDGEVGGRARRDGPEIRPLDQRGRAGRNRLDQVQVRLATSARPEVILEIIEAALSSPSRSML